MSEQQATNLVVARLFDYFGLRTDWQRRLWNPGTVTVLQETLEAIDLLDSGHLRTGTVTELVNTARRRAGPDLGVGSAAIRSTIEATLGTLQKSPGDRVARHQLEDLLTSVEAGYLTRWSAGLVDDVEVLAPESASRLLAGHLLGAGFSPDYLHRWATWLAANRPPRTLVELFNEAAEVVRRPARSWQVFVPFIALERHAQRMPPEWLDPAKAMGWMSQNAPEALVRHNGGLLIILV